MISVTRSIIDKNSDLISNYLRHQIDQIDKISVFSSSQYSSQASINRIYVSIPTNISINVTVKNGKIEKIEEKSDVSDVLFRKYCLSPAETIIYGQSQIKKIDKGLTKYLLDGKEYYYSDTENRPLVLSPPWADGIKENYWVLGIGDILALYDKVVLLGSPGVGKSTSLRYLATQLSRNYLEIECNQDELITDLLFVKKYIPLYIELRDLSKWLELNHKKELNTQVIVSYLASITSYKSAENFTDLWEKLKNHNVIFMFDGLDEVYSSVPEYRITAEKLKWLTAQIKDEFTNVKILFASRMGEYVEYQLYDYKMVQLVLMEKYKSKELIKRLYKYHNVPISEAEVKIVLEDMEKKGIKRDITGNPLLLSLMIAIALNTENNTLPEQRSEILLEGIKMLIGRWYSITEEERPAFFNKYSHEEILDKIKQFAFESNENGLINLKTLLSFMQVDFYNSSSLITYLVRRAGLIVKKGNDYEFAHKSFRSYLAASYIVETGDCVKYLTEDIKKHFQRYQEESILVVEILFDLIKELDSNDSSISKLWYVIQLLVYTKNKNEWAIWLAGKILSKRNYLLLNIDYPLKDIILGELKRHLLDVLQRTGKYTNQDLDTIYRIECGQVLGYLGDIRKGIGIKDKLPDISWFRVEPGEFVYGIEQEQQEYVKSTTWGVNVSFERESPANKIFVDGFEISKYPITVAQYQCFLDAPDGYASSNWYEWSPIAVRYYLNNIKGKTFKFMSGNNFANYPASNISFFEAVAFCKWLSIKLNCSIRLPSDAEWEYVAKRNNTIFTWGNSFDSNKCNSLYAGLGTICSVGSFMSDDQDKEIPCDLCGNIWEWTQSFYTENHKNDTINTIINTEKNPNLKEEVLVTDRGGGYLNGPNCLRVSFRGRDPISNHAERNGFRIIRESGSFSGNIIDIPYDNQMYETDRENVKERPGYGTLVRRDDVITVWYSVYKNGIYLQQDKCQLKIGEYKLHKFIEDSLVGKRVAGQLNIEVKGKDCFDGKSFCSINPEDSLSFYVFILDISPDL